MAKNILTLCTREAFREWLTLHAQTEKECFLVLKRGKPVDDEHFWYLDAVEEALCFGWIDSTLALIEGVRMQRFTPRSKKSNWSELNKERVRRLEALGLMTDSGRSVLPDMGFTMDPALQSEMHSVGVWEDFTRFPPLYQRIRAGNLASAQKRSSEEFQKAFRYFIVQTKAGRMYGEWNDYGRLLTYGQPEDECIKH